MPLPPGCLGVAAPESQRAPRLFAHPAIRRLTDRGSCSFQPDSKDMRHKDHHPKTYAVTRQGFRAASMNWRSTAGGLPVREFDHAVYPTREEPDPNRYDPLAQHNPPMRLDAPQRPSSDFA